MVYFKWDKTKYTSYNGLKDYMKVETQDFIRWMAKPFVPILKSGIDRGVGDLIWG